MNYHTHNHCSGLKCTIMENLSVNFGSVNILDDINLHVHNGEFTVIIGPNGAGKSTLLRAILGEVKYDGSLIFLDSCGDKRTKPKIGYVPQSINMDPSSPTSVLDLYTSSNLRYPVFLKPSGKIINSAKECLKQAKADHLINKKIGSLSGGELQRVLLALALEPVPDLLLLDEPVSGMDLNGMELFYQLLSDLLKQYDISIIMVSHDFNLIGKHADRIVLLNKEILDIGKPSEVFQGEAFKNQFLPWTGIGGEYKC